MAYAQDVQRFEESVRNFAQTLPTDLIVPYVKRLALDALARLIAKTPVDEGRARGAWLVTFGSPATGEPGIRDRLKTKAPIESSAATSSSAYDAGLAALSALPPYTVVWITNNVPYIAVLEAGRQEGGGNLTLDTAFGPITGRRRGASGSIQAPNGMLRVTVQELATEFA